MAILKDHLSLCGVRPELSHLHNKYPEIAISFLFEAG